MHLPECVALPPESLFDRPLFRLNWRYVCGTVAALGGVRIEIDDRLCQPCWSAMEVRVDGERIGIDMSDFLQLHPVWSRFRLWLRFQHVPAFEPYAAIGSFPPFSYEDWGEHRRLARSVNYTAAGDSICYKVHSHPGGGLPARTHRREAVRRLLARHFPGQVDSRLVQPWTRFVQEAAQSLVAVHVPGAHPHILDRSVLQLWSVGVCVLSPDLWTTCLERRPVAGEHYLLLRDDYSDLVEKIHWCRAHRRQCARIGRQARDFFARQCMPRRIWQYVCSRLEGGEGAKGQGKRSTGRKVTHEITFSELLFPYPNPGNNQGDGVGVADLIGKRSVDGWTVASVGEALKGIEAPEASSAWRKIQEFREMGVEGIQETAQRQPFEISRRGGHCYLRQGCKRALALYLLGHKALPIGPGAVKIW